MFHTLNAGHACISLDNDFLFISKTELTLKFCDKKKNVTNIYKCFSFETKTL